jgi:uncharacterized protein (TIGR00730 family)
MGRDGRACHDPTSMTRPPPDKNQESALQLEAILHSPSYSEADRDLGFLDSAETRGVRLQLDYLKAELMLASFDVGHTVVVFGSTQIPDPEAARAASQEAAAAAAREPGDAQRARRAAVAARVAANSRYYDVARELGRYVGRMSDGQGQPRTIIMTGGGPGIMEAANRGAADVGAPSAGLNIHLPQPQSPNAFVTPQLAFQFHYFAVRKLHLLLRARALVAFPGGFGTLDELFETLTLVQTRKIAPLPIVLVGREFWQQAVNLDFLCAEGVIDSADLTLFSYADSAPQIWQTIMQWHAARGQPLV